MLPSSDTPTGSRSNQPVPANTGQALDVNCDNHDNDCGRTSKTSSARSFSYGGGTERSTSALLGSSSTGGGAAAVAARLETRHPARRRVWKGASNRSNKGFCPGKYCDEGEQGWALGTEDSEIGDKPTDTPSLEKKQAGAAVGMEARVDERSFELPLKV